MKLTNTEHAIILGTLLGDGCIEKNGIHARLRIEHGMKQSEYVHWKYVALQRWMTNSSPMQVHAYHKKHNRYYDSVRLYTRSAEAFDQYLEKFYVSKRKTIPKDIATLLNHPLSLAVWFMDDGYKRNDCNAFRINTDMFLREEQLLLQYALENNFGIKSSLHRKGNYWNIYIPQQSAKHFRDIVESYITPGFQYKITLAP